MAFKKLTAEQIRKEARLTREDGIELNARWQRYVDKRFKNLLFAVATERDLSNGS